MMENCGRMPQASRSMFTKQCTQTLTCMNINAQKYNILQHINDNSPKKICFSYLSTVSKLYRASRPVEASLF